MKFIYSYLLVSFLVSGSYGQTIRPDSGTFVIHKFAQAIGKEKYLISETDKGFSCLVDFRYTDRGSLVKLKDSICFSKNGLPLSYRIKGGTSRFSSIDDSVVFEDRLARIKVNDSLYTQPLPAVYFPVAGYAPATAQMLLIKYWKEKHFYGVINTPPFGAVNISEDGMDTVTYQNERKIFTRYHITGLIWGNELLWTDQEGRLICLITNDAEGDKQEMTLEPYESLLPFFISRAAVEGMRLFSRMAGHLVSKQEGMAIVHATLIDVIEKNSIRDATVIIENGKIKYAGKSSSVQIPKKMFVLDAGGKTILPGLWDMHAHFEQAEWGPAYLAAGVTTVRDCGNEFDYINAIKNSIDRGNGIGPVILKAGIIDGKGPFALGIIQADNPSQATAAVKMYKDSGFAQIKIYSSVKPAVLKVICSEAHRLGLTVTGHIPIGMNLEQAVDSGMDMVNHIQYISAILKKNKPDGSIDFSDSVNRAVMKFMKDHHLVIDPTLGVYELSFRSVKDNISAIEPNFSSLPEPMKPLFINTGSTTPQEIDRGIKIMKSFMQIVEALNENGIAVVAGTDMGFPGYSVCRELELYVAAGFTPMEAIRTATIIPAQVMRLESSLGSVDVGKNANLVILNDNPLEDIRNIRKVFGIIKDGQLLDPDELHKIAGFNKK